VSHYPLETRSFAEVEHPEDIQNGGFGKEDFFYLGDC
jgi:hypothetical protein